MFVVFSCGLISACAEQLFACESSPIFRYWSLLLVCKPPSVYVAFGPNMISIFVLSGGRKALFASLKWTFAPV